MPIAMIILLIVSLSSYTQTPVIIKTLNVNIYSAEKYESSKQNILALIDSCKCQLISMSETKTDNKNQKITIELAVNDGCFKKIDKHLTELGYISFKNIKTEDKTAEMDTAGISKDIVFLKENKSGYEGQLAKLKPDSELYGQLWQKKTDIETQIYEKEKMLASARIKITAPHKMQITICE